MSENQELVLYYIPTSSFSQKIVLALHYLNLKFEEKLVHLSKGDHLQEWYLDINPKGEVPTLKDGNLIVADSAAILQYLNDTYDKRRSDEEKILPNPMAPLGKQVQSFTELLCTIRIPILTFGSIFYPKYTIECRMSDQDRNERKTIIEKSFERMSEKSKTARSPYKECYTNKMTRLPLFVAAIKNEDKFVEELESTKKVLDAIEDQLASVKSKWLFHDFLTAADITLLVVLNRINLLGLQHHFFSEGARPKTLAYFKRSLNEHFVKQTFA